MGNISKDFGNLTLRKWRENMLIKEEMLQDLKEIRN